MEKCYISRNTRLGIEVIITSFIVYRDILRQFILKCYLQWKSSLFWLGANRNVKLLNRSRWCIKHRATQLKQTEESEHPPCISHNDKRVIWFFMQGSVMSLLNWGLFAQFFPTHYLTYILDTSNINFLIYRYWNFNLLVTS